MRHARSIQLAEHATGDSNATEPASGEAPAVNIWTDGACRGNPGPGGWGAVMRSGSHLRELHGGEAETTNNRMELTAVIEALTALKRPSRVIVHTDSQYVRLGITQWLEQWRRRGWKTADKKPVKNVDLWQRLSEVAARHHIDWQWVPGHAGIEGNERADALANLGCDEALGRAGTRVSGAGR